jgi:hypothetical protein
VHELLYFSVAVLLYCCIAVLQLDASITRFMPGFGPSSEVGLHVGFMVGKAALLTWYFCLTFVSMCSALSLSIESYDG